MFRLDHRGAVVVVVGDGGGSGAGSFVVAVGGIGAPKVAGALGAAGVNVPVGGGMNVPWFGFTGPVKPDGPPNVVPLCDCATGPGGPASADDPVLCGAVRPSVAPKSIGDSGGRGAVVCRALYPAFDSPS